MLNVANWSDKQLDELVDLLRTADFSAVASFISKNFLLGTGSRIMDDPAHIPLRFNVGSDTTTVTVTPGVFQHNGLISQIDSTEVINILNPLGPGNWGPGLAADPALPRYTIVSVKWDETAHTIENRWFVDDTVSPNLYSQRATLTLINKVYFNIIVTHGTPGGGVPSTPSGYFTICEIYIPAAVITLGTVGGKGTGGVVITDTQDGQSIQSPKNWYTIADYPPYYPTRVLRLEFWSTMFGVDHDTTTGYHRAGLWHIGATPVTSSADELNRLDGVGASVTAGNLTALTNGSNVGTMHLHGGYLRYALLEELQPSGTNGGGFASGSWLTRTLNTEYDNDGIVTLAANQFTLGAGTYQVFGSAPGVDCGQHKAILYNVTDATIQIVGTAASGGSANVDETRSFIIGTFTIGIPKVFEIRHQCKTTCGTYGRGKAAGMGVDEIYTFFQIIKIL